MDDGDSQKLAKLCGMLGSNHDGERASAALKASEFLKSRASGGAPSTRYCAGDQSPRRRIKDREGRLND